MVSRFLSCRSFRRWLSSPGKRQVVYTVRSKDLPVGQRSLLSLSYRHQPPDPNSPVPICPFGAEGSMTLYKFVRLFTP